MRLRPLALALSLAVLPICAQAEDLFETYQLARSHDPQLAASEAGQRATAEGQVQARAALLPQINAGLSASRSRSISQSGQAVYDPVTGVLISGGRSTSDSTGIQANIGVSQVVYNAGLLGRHREQKLQVRAGEHEVEAANDNLITRTSQAYFNVLVALETLAAAEAQEAALRKQFEYASKRLEVGLAPITDQHEARAQYENARANTITQRNALEDARQALVEITGRPVENMMALPDDFTPQLPAEAGVEEWVNKAIENNPSLAAQKTRLDAAEEGIQTARAGYLPSVNASGSYGYNRSDSRVSRQGNASESDGWSRNPSVGLSVSIPIFSGGAVQSQVRQAIAQRDVTAQQLEQQKRALERSARSAHQNLTAGISALEARRFALVAAQSAYDASQVGLEVGTRTVIDVLINQQNLFNAQQAYAQAKYSYLQSYLALRQVAGTLEASDLQDINRLLSVPAGRVPQVTR